MPLLLFGPLGLPEILIILLLCAVFFGAKKIPQLGTGLGLGIRNFKDSVTGKTEHIESGNQEPQKASTETKSN